MEVMGCNSADLISSRACQNLAREATLVANVGSAPALHIGSWETSSDMSLYLMFVGKIILLALAFARFG